jgi:hypothetical protein
LCLDRGGKKRPAEFKTAAGNADEVLLVLKRKPAGPARAAGKGDE